MGLLTFFQSVWDLVRWPIENCTSCCDILDPDYYCKTSPGVYTTSQMFNHWEHDVKHDFTRHQSSLSPSSSSHVSLTQHSTSSDSRSRSDAPSNNSYSYCKEARDRQVQFLFYGGSDHPTATGGLHSSGYRSDMISNYALSMEPMSPAAIESPRINHEIPCFFSPQSPMSAPIYSPYIFRTPEQRTRRSTGYYSM